MKRPLLIAILVTTASSAFGVTGIPRTMKCIEGSSQVYECDSSNRVSGGIGEMYQTLTSTCSLSLRVRSTDSTSKIIQVQESLEKKVTVMFGLTPPPSGGPNMLRKLELETQKRIYQELSEYPMCQEPKE